MTERNNEEIDKIKQDLAEDQREQRKNETKVEQIRLKLKAINEEAVAKYNQEVELTKPVAEIAVNEIIQPWFSQLISTGTYKGLLEWAKRHDDIRITNTIIYYWPEDAIKALRNNDSFLSTAKFIAKEYKENDLEKAFKNHGHADEAWYTGVDIFSHDFDGQSGVCMFRRPVLGMGFAFAMMQSNYRILVDPENVAGSLNRVAPEVWIKFASQVESDEVWELIENSMKPRKRASLASVKESRDWRDRDRQNSEQYFRNRVWH